MVSVYNIIIIILLYANIKYHYNISILVLLFLDFSKFSFPTYFSYKHCITYIFTGTGLRVFIDYNALYIRL